MPGYWAKWTIIDLRARPLLPTQTTSVTTVGRFELAKTYEKHAQLLMGVPDQIWAPAQAVQSQGQKAVVEWEE